MMLIKKKTQGLVFDFEFLYEIDVREPIGNQRYDKE